MVLQPQLSNLKGSSQSGWAAERTPRDDFSPAGRRPVDVTRPMGLRADAWLRLPSRGLEGWPVSGRLLSHLRCVAIAEHRAFSDHAFSESLHGGWDRVPGIEKPGHHSQIGENLDAISIGVHPKMLPLVLGMSLHGV